MDRTLEDFIESSLAARSIEDVSRAFHGALSKMGLGASAFGRYHAGELTGFFWDRLPGDFAGVYLEQRWDRVDPLLQKAARRRAAFLWRSDAGDPQLTPEQRGFFSELRSRGIRQGVMTPVHGPNGQLELCGTLSDQKEAVSPKVMRTIQGLVMQASLCCGDLAHAPAPSAPSLSLRELECLKWLRDNKSNWEIGQILQISEKTVEFHVGNLMRKLHVEGRLAAVLTGIRVGLLPL